MKTEIRIDKGTAFCLFMNADNFLLKIIGSKPGTKPITEWEPGEELACYCYTIGTVMRNTPQFMRDIMDGEHGDYAASVINDLLSDLLDITNRYKDEISAIIPGFTSDNEEDFAISDIVNYVVERLEFDSKMDASRCFALLAYVCGDVCEKHFKQKSDEN